MASFLTSELLSQKIREVLSGENRRCAVAFWGSGASELLKACSKVNSMDAKIVCDLSMGGTYPKELEALGAPKNERLRYHDSLHAKVYISDSGAIVASANVSSNGIGFRETGGPKHLEAGSFYDRNDKEWDSISQWFDKTYEGSKVINEQALGIARTRWSPTREQVSPTKEEKTAGASLQTNSLLDMVRNDPSTFKNVGFVFVRGIVSSEDAKTIKHEISKKYPRDKRDIMQSSRGNMFMWDDEDEVRIWPNLFFEFYITKNKLRVFAREIGYRDTDAFIVKGAALAVKNQVGLIPPLKSVGQADAQMARKIIGDEGGVFFANADDLLKRLIEVEYESSVK
jgi:hypothetical protein